MHAGFRKQFSNDIIMKQNSQFTPPTQRILKFDVADAKTDRFICTMEMPFNPLFKVSILQLLDFVFQQRPSLKRREIVIEL